jgi:hypothetical protein
MTQQQGSGPVVPVKRKRSSDPCQNADRSKKVNTGTKSHAAYHPTFSCCGQMPRDFRTERAQSSVGAAMSCASRVLRQLGASNPLRHGWPASRGPRAIALRQAYISRRDVT